VRKPTFPHIGTFDQLIGLKFQIQYSHPVRKHREWELLCDYIHLDRSSKAQVEALVRWNSMSLLVPYRSMRF